MNEAKTAKQAEEYVDNFLCFVAEDETKVWLKGALKQTYLEGFRLGYLQGTIAATRREEGPTDTV